MVNLSYDSVNCNPTKNQAERAETSLLDVPEVVDLQRAQIHDFRSPTSSKRLSALDLLHGNLKIYARVSTVISMIQT